ncbi:MAG: hypothetical protein RR262_18675 [Clostridium sp.]
MKKLYASAFEKRLRKELTTANEKDTTIADMIECVKVKKVKESYNVIISVNDLEIPLHDIKHAIYKVMEEKYNNEVEIGSILIEI